MGGMPWHCNFVLRRCYFAIEELGLAVASNVEHATLPEKPRIRRLKQWRFTVREGAAKTHVVMMCSEGMGIAMIVHCSDLLLSTCFDL